MSKFVNNNVSACGDNNMKINLNLKVEKIRRDCSPICL